MFLGSSVVEQLAVNQLVGGSNPSQGARDTPHPNPLPQGERELDLGFIPSPLGGAG